MSGSTDTTTDPEPRPEDLKLLDAWDNLMTAAEAAGDPGLETLRAVYLLWATGYLPGSALDREIRHRADQVKQAIGRSTGGLIVSITYPAELVAAARKALALLTGDGTDGTLGHHSDNPVPAALRNAIALYEDRSLEGVEVLPAPEDYR